MVKIILDPLFKKKFSKIKDKKFKIKIIKQIEKLKLNPEFGKPMKNVRKGTRELYVKPYRLSYIWEKGKLIILLLDLYHKDKQ